MIDIKKLSKQYFVRRLTQKDAQQVECLQQGNPMYYKFCPPAPSIKSVLNQMNALPPGKELRDKYFIGFFEEEELIAVMDLIEAYPNQETVFIGFFMVSKERSGLGIGSNIIKQCLHEIERQGFSFVRLGYMKGNLQSENFWRKCQFTPTGIETDNGQGIVVVLEKEL